VTSPRSELDASDGAVGTDHPPVRRPLTTAEIAELAGVSIATVSKVLNGRSEVADETRAMVERVIREHGHRPQKRRSNQAPLIELLSHRVAGRYSLEMVKGVQSVAHEHGLAVVLTDYSEDPTTGGDWTRGVLARRSIGVVAAFAAPDRQEHYRLLSRNIPVVLVDPTGEPDHAVPSVGSDHWSGALVATRHLLGLGHRRIAVVTGPRTSPASLARFDGFRSAMDQAGVPVDHALVRHGTFEIESGIEEGRELLSLSEPPTAVLAFNDDTALGVYHAAAETGLRIPHDVSVVGFDDMPDSRWMIPKLTTVRQPLADMAAAATRMLLSLAHGEVPQSRTMLATQLIVRSSSGAPR